MVQFPFVGPEPSLGPSTSWRFPDSPADVLQRCSAGAGWEAERRSGTARTALTGMRLPYVHDVHHVPEEASLSDTSSV
jgi:hypothetical protein